MLARFSRSGSDSITWGVSWSTGFQKPPVRLQKNTGVRNASVRRSQSFRVPFFQQLDNRWINGSGAMLVQVQLTQALRPRESRVESTADAPAPAGLGGTSAASVAHLNRPSRAAAPHAREATRVAHVLSKTIHYMEIYTYIDHPNEGQ